ncbi:MAG: hypothetical protein AB1469_02855 [Pseudomonadota bacterium]
MKKITATELVRNMRQVLDHLSTGEEVIIERNHQPVARLHVAPADVADITGEAPVYLSPVTLAELKFGVDITLDPATACLPKTARISRAFRAWTWR